MRNTPYALRTYLQTYDNTVSKYVPLDLFPDQISLIEDYDAYNENKLNILKNRIESDSIVLYNDPITIKVIHNEELFNNKIINYLCENTIEWKIIYFFDKYNNHGCFPH